MVRILILYLVFSTLTASGRPGPELQIRLGGYAGSPYGAGGTIGLTLGGRHTAGTGYWIFARNAYTLPAEFRQQNLQSPPHDRLAGPGIAYTYTFLETGRRNRVALVLGAAAILAQRSTPWNFRRDFSAAAPETYYAWDRRQTRQAAFLLQPELRYRFSRWLCGAAGPYGVFSSGFNGGGLRLALIFGS